MTITAPSEYQNVYAVQENVIIEIFVQMEQHVHVRIFLRKYLDRFYVKYSSILIVAGPIYHHHYLSFIKMS